MKEKPCPIFESVYQTLQTDCQNTAKLLSPKTRIVCKVNVYIPNAHAVYLPVWSQGPSCRLHRLVLAGILLQLVVLWRDAA